MAMNREELGNWINKQNGESEYSARLEANLTQARFVRNARRRRFILRYILLPIAAFVLGWSLYTPAHASGTFACDRYGNCAGSNADERGSSAWSCGQSGCSGGGSE